LSSMPPRLAPSDRVLLRALDVWGNPEGERLWSAFGEAWRERLRAAGGPAGIDPESALRDLRREHEAEARIDPDRVHPSWWVRALQEESPAVRRAVASHIPSAIRHVVRRGLGLAGDDLAPDRAPQPEVLRVALSLWPERLVGGPTSRDDDPPVIVALTRLDRRSLLRLIATTGLAKRAFALAADPLGVPEGRPLRARDRERLEQFRASWGEVDHRLARVAHDDLVSGAGDVLPPPWLGLVTIGRLLSTADPVRVRWALQHLPYQAAKFTRGRMMTKVQGVSWPTLLDWEAQVLQAAQSRLRAEGRLGGPEGGLA
jgi:hypothetical protein